MSDAALPHTSIPASETKEPRSFWDSPSGRFLRIMVKIIKYFLGGVENFLCDGHAHRMVVGIFHALLLLCAWVYFTFALFSLVYPVLDSHVLTGARLSDGMNMLGAGNYAVDVEVRREVINRIIGVILAGATVDVVFRVIGAFVRACHRLSR